MQEVTREIAFGLVVRIAILRTHPYSALKPINALARTGNLPSPLIRIVPASDRVWLFAVLSTCREFSQASIPKNPTTSEAAAFSPFSGLLPIEKIY